ncbi:MAG: CDP-diacylglycerol--glycerol-3-phosphate 3-phosphatidyltransferase [Clostridia bacterium]|nr:CDP-diacylglycerol--glycerol-3-phosphate 3-phosphatidyltransferase [Clostridia bacterium]
MNLPNKLTVLRVLFIPIIMIFLLVGSIPFRWLIGGLCFGAASLTDMLDGRIARKRNLITDFGKLMDPVADKMLIMSTLICFVQENICGAWVVVVILFREFLVTSMRMIAADKGKVIAANMWGKAKTVTQMIAVIGIFCSKAADEFAAVFSFIPSFIGSWLMIVSVVVLYTAVAATIFSGARYMYDARDLFRDL